MKRKTKKLTLRMPLDHFDMLDEICSILCQSHSEYFISQLEVYYEKLKAIPEAFVLREQQRNWEEKHQK